MLENQWQSIKHFTKEEFGLFSNKMDYLTILLFDEFRAAANTPIKILSAYDLSGHSANSLHYLGKAIDGCFIRHFDPLDAYIIADKIGFNGFGLYYNGIQFSFHCDTRPLNASQYKLRWIGIKSKEKGIVWDYIEFNAENLKKYFIK